MDKYIFPNALEDCDKLFFTEFKNIFQNINSGLPNGPEYILNIKLKNGKKCFVFTYIVMTKGIMFKEYVGVGKGN